MEQTNPSTVKSVSLGTVYYVATNGSDQNPGTSSAPFLSIMRAAHTAQPGDEIVVRDGIYTAETSTMNMVSCIGNPENYITFRSETKYGAILDGKNISAYCFSLVYGASYLKFVDFEIRNFLRFGFDINHSGYESSYVTIQGCKIRDIGRISDIQSNGRCGIFIGQKNHHITIEKNLIFNIGRTGPDDYFLNKDHAIYIADPLPDLAENAAHHNLISYNIMYNISGSHLTMGSNNDLIANNVLAWVNENSRGGNCFIYSGSRGCFNETIANNIFFQLSGHSPFVIWASSGTSGWSVKSNIVYGGQMWYDKGSSGWAEAMKGGNFGRIDCEFNEVNPLFVSPVKTNDANVDFRLQPLSPAIDKGAVIGLTSDYLNKRIGGIPDIGAYEF